MKICDIEGCTAPESQLMPCPLLGAGLVYSCKEHLLLLKAVWGDKLLADERVLQSYCQTPRLVCEYGRQEGKKCQKEEKVKQTEV